MASSELAGVKIRKARGENKDEYGTNNRHCESGHQTSHFKEKYSHIKLNQLNEPSYLATVQHEEKKAAN